MNTVWNKLDEWKKKSLIALALVSAVNINLNAQRPYQYQEVSVDRLSEVLAQRSNSRVVVSEAPQQHPAYANRAAYYQDQDQVVVVDGTSCVYSSYYSSGIDPYANPNERLSGVYRNINQEDQYILLYQRPDGSQQANRVSGTYLRDIYKNGRGGFYAHPDFSEGYYGSGYNPGPHHHRRTRAGEAARGVGDILEGLGRIIHATQGRR